MRLVVIVAALVAAVACGRDRTGAGAPAESESATAQSASLVHFTGNADAARRGRFFFLYYNCYTCHGGYGGGGFGPNLRDTVKRYGNSDAAISQSISQGRPLGMPRWSGTMPDSEVPLLVAYIHSMRTDAEPKFFFVSLDSSDTHLPSP